MRLALIETDLRTGDVLLFRGGRSLFERLIRWYTRSEYSHAGVLIYQRADGCARWCVMEAMPTGIRMVPLDVRLEECEADGCAVDWYAVFDPAIRMEKVAGYVLRQWGKRYASWLQFVLSFGRITNWFRRLLGRPPRLLDKQRFFCSELVAAAFAHAGAELPDQPYRTPPGEIAAYPFLKLMGTLEV